MLTLRERSQHITPGELLFTEAATRILLFPLAEPIDKDAVYAVIKKPEMADDVTFWNALLELPNGQDILGRWWNWMTSCHETCTYHRTTNAIGACEPHNLTLLLETFVESVDELEAGELDKTLGLEYQALGLRSDSGS